MSKAFDTVQHEWIFLVLKKFGFGPRFIKLIKACTSNNIFKVALYDGRYSKSYQIGCGVRQGDAISLLLFALAIELIVRAIKNSSNIKGISTPSPKKLKIPFEQCSIKILAYADDICLIGNQKDLKMPQTP
jgi:hypothetical protein